MNSNQIKTRANQQFPAMFVSDIHLSPTSPKTAGHFLAFLNEEAKYAQRLYLLGDIFEYWAGDDDLENPEHHGVIKALKALAQSGTELFWIAGNRDFLVGQKFASHVGIKLLPDPFALTIAGRQLVLSHGDELCTDDTEYIKFRTMVRQPQWQSQFLAQDLAQRKAIISHMRQKSHEEQQAKAMSIMDVNATAVNNLFAKFQDHDLIHGHTHRHAIHKETSGTRYVLPDWEFDGHGQHRGAYLVLDTEGQLHFEYIADAVILASNT